jgi:signal transduction histidine kinase
MEIDMQRIIDDVLDASKFQKGMVRFEREEFNVCTMARGIIDLFRSKSSSKGVGIELSTQEDPLYIESDRVRIAQVLTNLLSNAVKFTDAGKIFVSIATQLETNENGFLTEYFILRVQDTGIGIPEGYEDRIFQTFEQTTDGASRGGSYLQYPRAATYIPT